ncbi:MAG: hypothetical protein ACI8Y8_004108, partial [Planctomycetota bacterium]
MGWYRVALDAGNAALIWRHYSVHGNCIHYVGGAKERKSLVRGFLGLYFLGLGIWSKNRARLRLCPVTPGVGTQRVLPTPAVTGQRR